jgi:hypothetical protein
MKSKPLFMLIDCTPDLRLGPAPLATSCRDMFFKVNPNKKRNKNDRKRIPQVRRRPRQTQGRD